MIQKQWRFHTLTVVTLLSRDTLLSKHAFLRHYEVYCVRINRIIFEHMRRKSWMRRVGARIPPTNSSCGSIVCNLPTVVRGRASISPKFTNGVLARPRRIRRKKRKLTCIKHGRSIHRAPLVSPGVTYVCFCPRN